MTDASREAVSDSPEVLAFYLPQFHPIAENNRWWGEGFTEWTNVARAKPRFGGHRQPRLPASLGFYDLRLDEVRAAQAALARTHGVTGFCYYHYWFQGRRLLERPLEQLRRATSLDFPFCVCWANESWSRRWDGGNRDILMPQTYSPEDDLDQIRYLCELMADPRYIRVDGRPLLLVYRTESLPDPRRTAELWRSEALRLGVGELFLGSVESFLSGKDPRDIGFDASIEFAPDWRLLRGRVNETRLEGAVRWRLERLADRWRPDRPLIVDYDRVVARMLAKPPVSYPFFRCACPSWDNTPRRKTNPTILRDATPSRYGAWLEQLLRTRQTQFGYEAPVFVNAWNEWAEGAILEPCDQFGRAFLEATRDAIQRAR